MKITTKSIVKIGLIAAVYAAITISIAPISYGLIQFRVSEVMTLLAFVDPIYIPGLVLGCVISNMFSSLGIIDIVVGSTATFISVYMISKSKNLFIASIWPTVINGLFIGAEIHFVLNQPFLISSLYVAMGEFCVVTLIGYPLFKFILNKKFIVKILKV
ncbi:QueT transporter family protein [Tepidibacter thalassicus]|uniref:Uncharacterized membrane protein n=1 Tax=Tepidibacter thalassicus DSM 15285 TaxID=1123350 RepID=A0A1M5PHE4_9FIRM|nr:QueT transporter family protein [Tepidibacter thalassicus]SHH01138.1 Uncharacterized membrane protein [Tepidibacter thalassicus DSM 15285]